MLNYRVTNKGVRDGHFKESYPEIIEGGFDCSLNELLTSLEGSPKHIGTYFFCHNTSITSLQGGPETIGTFFNCHTTKITSLEYAPLIVNDYVNCSGNKITSLEGIGKRYLKEIGTFLILPASIKSNILGIMLIKNLKNIEFMFKTKTNEYEEIENIINRHLKSDRDILECQEELIDKGFKQYAKL